MITSGENWKTIVKPFLKEKKFFFMGSKQSGKSLILTYKKADLLAIITFHGGEVSIELTEGADKALYLEELELLLS